MWELICFIIQEETSYQQGADCSALVERNNIFTTKTKHYPRVTENTISPKEVIKVETSKLQSCGLSISKCNYIREIANFSLKNE